MTVEVEQTAQPGRAGPAADPWNFWVMSLQGSAAMSGEESRKYREGILRLYRESSLVELLGRNPVGVVLVRNPDRDFLKGFRQSKTGDYTLVYPTGWRS